MSDTHDRFWSNVPEGDLLIHAGDLTNSGTIQDLQQQINWLKSLPHKHKVVIAGNHDAYLDPRARRTLLHSESEGELDWGDIRYLQHSSIRLTFPKRGARALHIYAAPHIPAEDQPSWAFTYPPGVDAWSDTVPNDVDVLVTHGPPQFHLDVFGVGCRYLLKECWRAKPKLHVFGHAHTGYGYEALFWDDFQRTYEILCARNRGACAVSSLLSIYNWLHLFSMIFYGMKSILWSNVWGGSDDATLMLNTSLSYQNSGKLGNSPQIALI